MPAPAYDGRTVWLPDLGKLLPGDILLSRSVYGETAGGDKDARLIRAASGGRFEHAAICTSPPTFAEAGGGDGGGVFTLSLGRCFTHDLKNIRALRWPDSEVAARAAQYCQRQVGRPYSRIKAIASIVPLEILKNDRGVFCSSLVAHAYKQADPKAFKYLRPDKITPAGLGRLRGFRDITKEFFHEGLAPRNVQTLAALDGVQTYSPAYHQTMITLAYAKVLLPLSDRLFEALGDAELDRPETFFGALAFLPPAFNALAGMEEGRRAAYVDALHALDDAAADLLRDGRLSGVMDEMVAMDSEQRQRTVMESHRPAPDIDLGQLRSLVEARKRSLVARRKAYAGFGPYENVFESLRLWNALQNRVNGEIEDTIAEHEEILARLAPS